MNMKSQHFRAVFHSKTKKEALENIKEAIELYLEPDNDFSSINAGQILRNADLTVEEFVDYYRFFGSTFVNFHLRRTVFESN